MLMLTAPPSCPPSLFSSLFFFFFFFCLQVSLARHLRAQGFDTWVVEMRGAGLSYREGRAGADEGDGGGRRHRVPHPPAPGNTRGWGSTGRGYPSEPVGKAAQAECRGQVGRVQ